MHPVLHAHQPGPFEVGRKIPTISKGFEAGPGHTETVVNFTPGCRGALQVHGAVAGTVTGVTLPPQQGTAAGDAAGTEPSHGCWLGSQPAQHPSCSHASGWNLPSASQI